MKIKTAVLVGAVIALAACNDSPEAVTGGPGSNVKSLLPSRTALPAAAHGRGHIALNTGKFSIDTLQDSLVLADGRALHLHHKGAMNLAHAFATINQTDSLIAVLKRQPRFASSLAAARASGYRMRVVHAPPTRSGAPLHHRVVIRSKNGQGAHSSSLLLGSAPAGSRVRQAGANRSPASEWGLESFAPLAGQASRSNSPLPDDALGVAAAGWEPEMTEPATDDCYDIEQQMAGLTAEYEADRDTFEEKLDEQTKEQFEDFLKALANGASLDEILSEAASAFDSLGDAFDEVGAASLYGEAAQLGYLATVYVEMGCTIGDPDTGLDNTWDTNGPDGDLFWDSSVGTDGAWCYEEVWEVDVSYDGGNTWQFKEYDDVETCDVNAE